MGILLCEQHFPDVWIRNKSVRAEIGQFLRTHTHTTAAKLVVRIIMIILFIYFMLFLQMQGAHSLLQAHCYKLCTETLLQKH